MLYCLNGAKNDQKMNNPTREELFKKYDFNIRQDADALGCDIDDYVFRFNSLIDECSKQEAFNFFEFKETYRRIEAMNVRHDQIENFVGQMYSWVGASDEKIWEAYKKGEQLKRYFEK